MIAGHYVTALIAHQKFPKGTLLFFLLASQFQDFVWFTFHYLGLEPTGPSDVLDATVENLTVMMTYSHHLIPQIIWGAVVFLIGRLMFKSTTIGLVGLALFSMHFVLDFFSGHQHHLFGESTMEVGLGLYKSGVLLALLIEAVFVVVALWFYFSAEAKAGIKRTLQNRMVIIGVFVYAIVFVVIISTTSVRQWLGVPSFDLGFNTSVPTLIFTYAVILLILYKAVPHTIEQK